MKTDILVSPARRRLLRTGLAIGIAMPLASFRTLASAFAPSSDLWDRWLANEKINTSEPDFAAWDLILGRYLRPGDRGPNLFDYGAVTAADRQVLKSFVADMARVPVSGLSRQVQLPYWVNMYNALTIDVVLDDYPVRSIRDIDISPGFFADGPWDKKLVEIESETLSLNDIEHRILRPIWRDPRLHYVVNCAAIGCPKLETTAYSAATMEQSLEETARNYVNDPRGISIRAGRVTVSRIYDWFIEDFGDSESGVIAHLKRYAAAPVVEQLAAIGRGGYVLREAGGPFDAIIMATGSEVGLAMTAADELAAQNVNVRVVSMPNPGRFMAQDRIYRESVIPADCKARVAVEAGTGHYWYPFVGDHGRIIGIDRFGASAPAPELFEHYGITVANVSDAVRELLDSD